MKIIKYKTPLDMQKMCHRISLNINSQYDQPYVQIMYYLKKYNKYNEILL